MTGYAPMSKKVSKGCVFSDIGAFFKRGCVCFFLNFSSHCWGTRYQGGISSSVLSVFFTDKFYKEGGISSSVSSVFFTDKFALSQSDARISVAYKISQ